MFRSPRHVLQFAATAILAVACTGDPSGPEAVSAVLGESRFSGPLVRISEFHYDNASTDVGEQIEISGPAGTSLVGWSVVLYNGDAASRAVYDTKTLSGTIPATCGSRGVVVVTYPSNGIQNGSPDGIALVSPGGVIEFFSYEGSFVAANGPASGMTGADIGVFEPSTTPVGHSLSRNAANVWLAPGANTFGACNDNDTSPPAAPITTVTVTPASATVTVGGTRAFTATATDASGNPVSTTFIWTSSSAAATVNASGLATGQSAGDANIIATAPNGVTGSGALHVDAAPPGVPATRFSEIHYDNNGTDLNERIEVEGLAGTDLTGWSIALYNETGGALYDTRPLSGTIPSLCSGRGVVFVAVPGIQNGPADGFALIDAAGAVVEFLSYEGTLTATNGPASGRTSTDIGVAESGTGPSTSSLQREPGGLTWYGPTGATFGTCNLGSSAPPAPSGYAFTFTGRTSSDPALPVGYQDQLFVTIKDGGVTVTPAFTWSSDTPGTASIDAFGVVSALSAGSMTLRVTTSDGQTATTTLASIVATAGGTASYAGNTEFGVPSDADGSDDYVVARTEYSFSFNKNKGTPNWVSYDLEASHFGAQDRCDCFTYDPLLPADFPRYTTADYTGAGTFHGYGIDRGHLARSFDRTTGNLDNARTFLFSNIIPQAADLNQGPWAVMEAYLGDLARFSNKEVYIITGPAGSKGTVKNEGKMTIPVSVWKVAVIMPRDRGLADVYSSSDVEVIAVIAPNDAGVRSVDWNTWRTTVDAVEALSGYDLLALLPDGIERIVEAGDRPPVASAGGPYTASEATGFQLDARGSTDPDAGQTLTYSWTFGDGTTGTGAQPSKTYADNGSFTATVTVTDPYGATSSASATVTVNNVPPTGTFNVVTPTAGSSMALSFVGATDLSSVDRTSLKFRFDCGTGAYGALQTSALTNCPLPPGPAIVRGKVVDKDGGFTEYSQAYAPAGDPEPIEGLLRASTTVAPVKALPARAPR